jgi:hypothetical protein
MGGGAAGRRIGRRGAARRGPGGPAPCAQSSRRLTTRPMLAGPSPAHGATAPRRPWRLVLCRPRAFRVGGIGTLGLSVGGRPSRRALLNLPARDPEVPPPGRFVNSGRRPGSTESDSTRLRSAGPPGGGPGPPVARPAPLASENSAMARRRAEAPRGEACQSRPGGAAIRNRGLRWRSFCAGTGTAEVDPGKSQPLAASRSLSDRDLQLAGAPAAPDTASQPCVNRHLRWVRPKSCSY